MNAPRRASTTAAHVREYYRRVDADDVDGLVRLFSETCEYRRPGYPTIRGRGELTDFYRQKRVIRSGAHDIVRIIALPDCATVCGSFSGTVRSGEAVSAQFADVFELGEEGLIDRRVTYFFTALL